MTKSETRLRASIACAGLFQQPYTSDVAVALVIANAHARPHDPWRSDRAASARQWASWQRNRADALMHALNEQYAGEEAGR